MIHNISRFIAALAILATAQGAWAQSSFSGGSGTKADPYKISSSADLVQLATDINNSTSRLYEDQYFVQTGNINMSGINFVPIGINDNSYHQFRGKYNGQNYTISNLTVNGSYDYARLFGYIYNGDIDNVRLVSPSITNTKTSYTSALVGFGNMPGIHNCLVISPTLSGGNSIGVFAGGQNAGNIKYTYYTGNNNYSNVGYTDGSNANTSIGHAYTLTLSGGETTSTTAAFTYNSTDYYAGTITLSNAAPAGWIYAYTVNGSPIDGTSFTINADATVALSRTPDPTHFSDNGDGSYTIKTATGWSVFCDCLDDNDTYNRFSGKTVKLGADIGTAQDPITRMAGGSSHDFTGTFDGDGKTLTIKYGSAESPHTSRYAAPFLYANDGCTIQNLHVAGEIYTSSTEAAGLIAKQYKTVNIRNCRSSVIIHSTMNGNGTHGGLVGAMYNDNSCQLTIEGCLFDGKILNDGGATTDCSGFVGYKYDNSSLTIRNSLYAPAALGTGEAEPTSNSATFARFDDNSHLTITNCYYTQTLGTAQGKQVLTNAAVQPVGEATATYSVSGLTLYGNGIQCGSTFYYDPERNMLHTVDGYGESTTCGWVFIASPVAESIAPSEVHNLFPSAGETSNDYDLYRFNQSSTNGKEWQNWKATTTENHPDFTSLANGQGYLYATKETRTLVFAGEYTAATAPVEVPLAYDENAQLKGWNLVGNPFTISATLTQPYYRMNAEGSALKTVTETTAVAAMEGVFVQATENNQTVTFTAQTRGGEKAAIAQANIMVGGDNGAVIDNAIIRFDGGQTLEKFSFREGSTKLYIPQDGTDYAIACAESTGEMPVNFKAEENGTYTLTVSTTLNSQLSTLNYLHLIDNMTGADVDLLTPAGNSPSERGLGGVYTFTANTTDYESRFKLVFAVGSSTGSDTFAFISNGNIIVNGEGTLQIFDAMGRQLFSKELSTFNSQLSTLNYTPGVYVLRLINGENVRTQKIVVE